MAKMVMAIIMVRVPPTARIQPHDDRADIRVEQASLVQRRVIRDCRVGTRRRVGPGVVMLLEGTVVIIRLALYMLMSISTKFATITSPFSSAKTINQSCLR